VTDFVCTIFSSFFYINFDASLSLRPYIKGLDALTYVGPAKRLTYKSINYYQYFLKEENYYQYCLTSLIFRFLAYAVYLCNGMKRNSKQI